MYINLSLKMARIEGQKSQKRWPHQRIHGGRGEQSNLVPLFGPTIIHILPSRVT